MPSGDKYEPTPEHILQGISHIAFDEGEEVRPGDRLRALQTLAKLIGMGIPADEKEEESIVDDL